MKTGFVLVYVVLLHSFAFGQTSIPSGMSLSPEGTQSELYVANLPSPQLPGGASGANQTWNFQNASFTKAADIQVFNCQTGPTAAAFPTANHCQELIPTPGSVLGNQNLYVLWMYSAQAMENLAALTNAAGTTNNYSPNPKTRVPLPFQFQQTTQDSYQKVGSGPQNITLTFDGYGTLQLPMRTINNVVRIRTDYSTSTDYDWWTLNPLQVVASTDESSNLLAVFLPQQSASHQEELELTRHQTHWIPETATLRVIWKQPETTPMQVRITNLAGQTMLEQIISAETQQWETQVNGWSTGIYTLQFSLGTKTNLYHFFKP
jgi:hypothetical protein